MEGFFHRIWRDSGVDKVSLLAHGVFVVRFHTIEDRDKVINGGYVFFDKKPLIMKPWNSKEIFCRETLSVVPVWIQLSNLDMKYWGVMRKILHLIGHMVKQDLATRNRERLEYARVLIEISIGQELPEQVIFDNEYGDPVAVGIYYEWRPILCPNCKKMGHTLDKCRKSTKPEQKWLPKEQEAGGVIGAKKNSQGVWVARKKSDQLKRPEPRGVALANGFHVLDSGIELAEEIQIGGVNSSWKMQAVKRCIQEKKAGIVCLLETRVKTHKLGVLYLNLFGGWCFTSNSVCHPNGRIILAWNPLSFYVDICETTSQYIHTWIKPKYTEGFATTFIYAHNEVRGRDVLWADLKLISSNQVNPWILMGDFNSIMRPDERIRARKLATDYKTLRDFVDFCGIMDI
ncbi:uncharacterized protein LOC133815585 [Humulus lupulus]|uniref:uncharacterized protein LOC133815585 n=1 Tax=Humulus lupulus TaxID=3486 RepID=UPI002B40BB42|nr:uncharacterized protein LOC133815585 [Humulus lupulus]